MGSTVDGQHSTRICRIVLSEPTVARRDRVLPIEGRKYSRDQPLPVAPKQVRFPPFAFQSGLSGRDKIADIGSAALTVGCMLKEYVLDGSKITSLETFYDSISDTLIPGAHWGRNLGAFNDILRGGFGTPEGGFVLRWAHSETSRNKLGYVETVRQLGNRLQRCHPTNRASVKADLAKARSGVGATVFDWLIEIIREHDAGGAEAKDGVRLLLD